MRRSLLALVAIIVVALPAVGTAYLCDALGQVVEVDPEFFPDALLEPPETCPPSPAVEDMAPQVDVPMPDDPTGFLLDQSAWDAANTDPMTVPVVVDIEPAYTQRIIEPDVRYGAR